MKQFNLFELTGLSFDPPEKGKGKVKKAIEEAKKKLGTELGSATQQLDRDEINAKIQSLDAFLRLVFDSASELTIAYQELAEEKLATEIENLKDIAVTTIKDGVCKIAESGITAQAKKFRLSKANVTKVYKEAGFEILDVDPIKAYPKFPTNAEKAYKWFLVLQKSSDQEPNAPDLSRIKDLYDFVAYLEKDFEHALEYRSKSCTELKAILDRHSKNLSMRNDNLGKLCADIAGFGKSYVFNSENNQRAYEIYLRYKSSKLTDLFAKLKNTTNLKDPKFADARIRTIAEVFGGEGEALAIYNIEAGLKNDPYYPPEVYILVQCSCQNFNKFIDLQEAQYINKCSSCAKALYKRCTNPNCGKTILASLEKCSECHFVFASVAMFGKHMATAEDALRRCDFDLAFQMLAKAKTADPSEKTKTSELQSRIETKERAYKTPIEKLRTLIAQKKFHTAKETVPGIINSFSGINIVEQERQINTQLTKVQTLFEQAKKQSVSKCADVCLDIVEECVDFKPALDFLNSQTPIAIQNISVTLNVSDSNATISWTRTGERSINYRIVRKSGNIAPKNELDGDIIIHSTTDTTFKDKTLQPGTQYSYSVFAERRGVFSTPASKTILLLADVAGVNYEQQDKLVHITWNAPKNCTGVTITRTCPKGTNILTSSAHNSYEDKNVEYGSNYIYKLQANYLNVSPSDGVSFNITPTMKINHFNISIAPIKDNRYKVSYEISRKDIDIRILANKNVLRSLKSDKGFCEIELPQNGFYTIEVAALSGGDWLVSQNNVQVNTFTSCEIDKSATKFEEKTVAKTNGTKTTITLRIKLSGNIPSHAKTFLYAVRTKKAVGDKVPWVGVDEVKIAADIIKTDAADYIRNGEMVHTFTANNEDAYYITIYTVYLVDGKNVISTPHKVRLGRPINANIFWKVTKSFFGKNKLYIEIKPNCPILTQPKMILCASVNDRNLLSSADTNADQITTYERLEFDTLQEGIQVEYEIPSEKASKITKNRKLFLFVETTNENEKFAVRWANGFTGKI